MATQKGPATGIKLTKKNRVTILKRAREIITDKRNWTTGRLRRKSSSGDGGYAYCLLGACEQAAYELGLFVSGETRKPFDEKSKVKDGAVLYGLGYELGRDISLYSYSFETRATDPTVVNDDEGHEAALELLDDYLAEVKKGNARPPEEV